MLKIGGLLASLGMLLVITAGNFWQKESQASDYQLITPAHFGNQYQIPADNPMSEAGVELGRHLFYDVRLSRNDSISCATCHQPQLGFTDGKARAVGIAGRIHSRSSMALVNLLWTKQFFWDGRVSSLEAQVLLPIQDPKEMDMPINQLVGKLQKLPEYPPMFKKAFGIGKISPQNIAKAIAQFERTLISGNARYDQIVSGKIAPSEREQRAIQLFMTHPIPEAGIRGGNCGDCHGGYLTQLNTFHNNGLEQEPLDWGLGAITGKTFDRGKMKAPSLRNIALTAPYMHDGRFKTLREVLDHYNDHVQSSKYLDPLIVEATNEVDGQSLLLTEAEKADIIYFLNMLTDSSFINNPKFANPFKAEKE
ncbi:MAG: cytochrome-c peroxidase [Microscillaceae bacterium]|jgi:cytochrome c peroxidase|nr:cytochrome-c peroxidase [Microscillaceae bacterium]